MGIAVALWLWPRKEAAPLPTLAEQQPPTQGRTIADSWQWQPEPKPTAAAPGSDPLSVGRISAAAVVRALGRVQFDERGKVVVDRQARDVLEDSLETLQDLTEEELTALQATLRAGLPGPQGERVAKIVTDYHRYRSALQVYERSTEAPTTPDGERTRLDYLAQLRDEYLGPVVARQFYAEDQALQRYLLETRSAGADTTALQKELQNGVFYLDSRTSSDAKELSRQMQQLREQGASDEYVKYVQQQQLGLYTANELPRADAEQSDWQQRYAQFKQERELVLSAGLAEQDKQAQIEQLLGQYFKPEELEAIHAFDSR